MESFEASGIRKVFELGKSLRDPVDLSIGQPHFDVPEPIKAAARAAIDAGHNGYTVTQGVAEHVGSLEPGKRADIVAVDGDPLTDVTVLTSMDFVMRDGRVYRDEP